MRTFAQTTDALLIKKKSAESDKNQTMVEPYWGQHF